MSDNIAQVKKKLTFNAAIDTPRNAVISINEIMTPTSCLPPNQNLIEHVNLHIGRGEKFFTICLQWAWIFFLLP